jgi:hypothetical protein
MESLVKAGHCVFCKTYIRPELDSGPHPRTEVKYCPNCGQQVWTKCVCGANLRYDDRFCENCGQKNSIFLKDDPDYLGDKIE